MHLQASKTMQTESNVCINTILLLYMISVCDTITSQSPMILQCITCQGDWLNYFLGLFSKHSSPSSLLQTNHLTYIVLFLVVWYYYILLHFKMWTFNLWTLTLLRRYCTLKCVSSTGKLICTLCLIGILCLIDILCLNGILYLNGILCLYSAYLTKWSFKAMVRSIVLAKINVFAGKVYCSG
jgi:hypothetical protein